MSDPLQGWLDLQRALKDTACGSNAKWDVVNPVRDIKKLNTSFVVPYFLLVDQSVTNTSYICRQFNYTMAQRFTMPLFKPNDTFGLFFCFLTIRFRVGTQVFRYIIGNYKNALFTWDFCPEYAGQVIEKNFCVEMWTSKVIPNVVVDVTNPNNLVFNTSILSVPTGACSGAPQVQPLQVVPQSSLFNPFPSDNPALFNDAGPWLTN